MYMFGILSNGITSMPDFMKIRPAILELLSMGDRGGSWVATS